MRNQPEPNQSNSKKPEWFELLDGDAPSAQVNKVNKKLPIIAAVVTGAVIASGALFSGASAENTTSQSVAASMDQTTSSPNSPAATTDSGAASTSEATQSATPAAPTVENPASGIQAPGNNRGDDDDYRDGREGHERGEGRDRDHDDD